MFKIEPKENRMINNSNTRRNFIKKTAATSALFIAGGLIASI